MKKILVILLVMPYVAFADGTLTSDIRISSEALGYDLQYRVYLPEGVESLENLPVLYITDGPGYITQGRVPSVLNRLIKSEKIEPNPSSSEDRRPEYLVRRLLGRLGFVHRM